MGVISTAGGFFAFFTTMYYYGFNIDTMFTKKLANIGGALRCNYDTSSNECSSYNIPYEAYNASLPNLGNPNLPLTKMANLSDY